MTIELKDCPMCGCKAAFVKHSAGMPGTQGFDKWDAVACKHCRTTVGACDRRFRCREDAAEAWNRRITPATLISAQDDEWKIVPLKPTDAMVRAGNKKTWPLPSKDVYIAMLAAAPAPQSADDQTHE